MNSVYFVNLRGLLLLRIAVLTQSGKKRKKDPKKNHLLQKQMKLFRRAPQCHHSLSLRVKGKKDAGNKRRGIIIDLTNPIAPTIPFLNRPHQPLQSNPHIQRWIWSSISADAVCKPALVGTSTRWALALATLWCTRLSSK